MSLIDTLKIPCLCSLKMGGIINKGLGEKVSSTHYQITITEGNVYLRT